MPDLQDGETAEIQGSAAKPYVIKNIGGVYSCSCPAWRNQSLGIERRTCKHIRLYRGEEAERQRLAQFAPVAASSAERTSATTTAAKTLKPTLPRLLLAETWTSGADIPGWWMSEKLDGVRAWWDGSQFCSRQGNRFYAPAWFTAGLPRVPLDGELWLGRKAFQRTVSIVRRQDECRLWASISFLVFDAPACDGPFEERMAFVRETLAECRPVYAAALEHKLCRGTGHLEEELSRIVALGGEGVMLRQPGSRYEAGRSATLLKVKRSRDAEALVIGHQPGAGRHKGRLGALLVVLPDGTEFSVGSGLTDAEREHPPSIGSTITFRYQELTDGGVPRFPTFVRVLRDMAKGMV